MNFYDAAEVQRLMAEHLRRQREAAGMSRDALAERSLVPASTIKKFELGSQISLRQFMLLWQSLDELSRLAELTRPLPTMPTSIEEVLNSDF